MPGGPLLQGESPLLHACANGKWTNVKLLLDNGAHSSVNVADGAGVVPLLMATSRAGGGALEAVKTLLSHKADPNVRTAAATALTNALLLHTVEGLEMAKLLLAAGANADGAGGADHATPLLSLCGSAWAAQRDKMMAAPEGGRAAAERLATLRVDMMNHLLKAGANPDTCGRDGKAPLAVLASTGDAVMLAALLAKVCPRPGPPRLLERRCFAAVPFSYLAPPVAAC